MAISEKKINKLINLLNTRTQKANEYFLKEIGKIIKELKELSPSEAHKLIQMLRYGSKYEDIVTELSNIVKINKKEVEKIFYNYAKNDQNFYENFYKYRNKPFVPFDENTLLKRQTKALAEIASEEFRNFTRSRALGYVFKDLNGNVIFQGLRETYERLLDEAVINIGQGKDTFNQSMKKILKEIGGSGLRTLNYESGRSIRLDSMIEMHLRSALKNLHNENQKIIAKEIDADGFEVTVHENPAPDHEDIQGYQFSIIKPSKDELSEWEKLQEGLVAKTYDGKEKQITHSKSGSYRPISEYNCYHNVQAVVLGVQKPQYSDEELEEIKKRNEKGFEYEGNHYTNYQGTQIQRLLERKIREQQDIQILAKTTGDETLVIESEQKINYLLSEYQKFSDKSGLAMDTSRIFVEGYRPLKKSEMNIPEKPFKFNFPKTQKKEEKIDLSKLSPTQIYISKEENKELAEYYFNAWNGKSSWDIRFTEHYEDIKKQMQEGFKDEVIDLNSPDGCNKLLYKINGKLSGDEINNIDSRLLADATRTMFNNALKCPAWLEDTKLNYTLLSAENLGSYTIAETKWNNVTLNSHFYKKYSDLYEAEKEEQEKGFHILTDEDKITLQPIVHETGHIIQSRISGEVVFHGKMFEHFKHLPQTEWGNYETKTIEKELIEAPIRRVMEKENLSRKEVIDKYVSDYGKKNYQEMFAETFASSQLGKPNSLSKELINYLEELGQWK